MDAIYDCESNQFLGNVDTDDMITNLSGLICIPDNLDIWMIDDDYPQFVGDDFDSDNPYYEKQAYKLF